MSECRWAYLWRVCVRVCVRARVCECEWPIASSMNGSDEVNKNSFNRKHKPSWNAARRRGRLCKFWLWSQTRALTGRRRAPLLQLWCCAPHDWITDRSVSCNILKAEESVWKKRKKRKTNNYVWMSEVLVISVLFCLATPNRLFSIWFLKKEKENKKMHKKIFAGRTRENSRVVVTTADKKLKL